MQHPWWNINMKVWNPGRRHVSHSVTILKTIEVEPNCKNNMDCLYVTTASNQGFLIILYEIFLNKSIEWGPRVKNYLWIQKRDLKWPRISQVLRHSQIFQHYNTRLTGYLCFNTHPIQFQKKYLESLDSNDEIRYFSLDAFIFH